MALKQTITLVDNFNETITFNDAYIRVERIEGSKQEMTVYLAILKSQEEKRPLVLKAYKFVPNLYGDNFIKQAYMHLKTLLEFAGATDC